MLREAIPASNDYACLDTHEYLGAEFEDAPPEVRAAVAVRSRRLPKPDMVRAAWSTLPAGVRDQIGEAALLHHFYALVHQRPDQGLSLDAGNRAARAADTASEAMDHLAMDALPILYGTVGAEPAWATSDMSLTTDLQTAASELHALAFPGEVVGLSPIQSAIALHKSAWRALQARAAFIKSTDDVEERWPFTWPVEEAEDEAVMDLLMVACRSRADAAALVAHLTGYLQTYPQHPKRPAMNEKVAAHIAIRLRDLSMILGREVAGAAPVAVPGDMAGLSAEHRAAWSAYLADPDALVKGSSRRFYLRDAVGEASGAMLLVPCADSAEVALFIEHAHWWRAELEAAGDTLADGFTCEAQEIRARAGDLSLLVTTTSH